MLKLVDEENVGTAAVAALRDTTEMLKDAVRITTDFPSFLALS